MTTLNYEYDRSKLDESKYGKNLKNRKFDNEWFDFEYDHTTHVFCTDKYSEEDAVSLFKELYGVEVMSVKIIAVRHALGGWYEWRTAKVGTRGSFPCWMITGKKQNEISMSKETFIELCRGEMSVKDLQ